MLRREILSRLNRENETEKSRRRLISIHKRERVFVIHEGDQLSGKSAFLMDRYRPPAAADTVGQAKQQQKLLRQHADGQRTWQNAPNEANYKAC